MTTTTNGILINIMPLLLLWTINNNLLKGLFCAGEVKEGSVVRLYFTTQNHCKKISFCGLTNSNLKTCLPLWGVFVWRVIPLLLQIILYKYFLQKSKKKPSINVYFKITTKQQKYWATILWKPWTTKTKNKQNNLNFSETYFSVIIFFNFLFISKTG